MTYVPFCHEGSQVFFNRFVRRYRGFGASEFHCLPVDVKISERESHRALKSDIIYLAGGNTFYFLKHLRKSGLIKKLQTFSKRGGVLTGLSAGALIMTPHIGLAGYPSFDSDENEVNLTNLKALNLVPFEYFPHYENTKRFRTAMCAYSKKTPHPVYACEDGGGIIIDGEEKTFFGHVYVFHQGHQFKV